MRSFNVWFRDRISRSSTNASENLKQLAKGPIFTILAYQGYDINGYTFYTVHQDNKSTYQNSGVRVDAFDGDNKDMSPYYGQIEEIWELDYLGFKVALFCCRWVHGDRGVFKDKYGFTSIDLKCLGYKSEPFVLAKQVSQVFYVPNTTNKRLHVVLAGKRRIVGVENAIDEDEFDQFDEIPPLSSIIKPILPLSTDQTLYLRSDHQEKVKNVNGSRRQRQRPK